MLGLRARRLWGRILHSLLTLTGCLCWRFPVSFSHFFLKLFFLHLIGGEQTIDVQRQSGGGVLFFGTWRGLPCQQMGCREHGHKDGSMYKT